VDLVTSREQIDKNIAELERLRQMGAGPQFRDYVSLIKLGTCFVPYKSVAGLAFAPSRFLGYVDNSLPKHGGNARKDGRLTNPAISEILGKTPEEDAELDERYRAFCSSLGFEARATGNFGAQRKFWPAPPKMR
jgi:putative restriction endonuclease